MKLIALSGIVDKFALIATAFNELGSALEKSDFTSFLSSKTIMFSVLFDRDAKKPSVWEKIFHHILATKTFQNTFWGF